MIKREDLLRRLLRERFGDAESLAREERPDGPADQARRRRDLRTALRRAYDHDEWDDIDRT